MVTILVTGARGNIGRRVISTLAASGYPVRGSARDAATLALPRGAEAADLDITRPAGAREALRDVTAVFLYPVRGDVSEFLAVARECGVGHVVLLSSPASYEAAEHQGAIGLAHRVVELAVESSGLPHTVLYPSWLATNAARDWGGQLRDHRHVGIAFPDAQVAPIHLDDVAEVAADLLTSDHNRGRMQVLTGPESLRLRDLVTILSDALGHPLLIRELTREQALAGRPPWLPEPVLAALLDGARASVGVPAPLTNTVRRITGHPARTFGEWADAHHDEFAPMS
jgi:uncharacterized protein YbjT (DUF2867 family)